MDRLNDLTDGNADSLRELIDMYFKQTTQQFAQIAVGRAREKRATKSAAWRTVARARAPRWA